MYKVLIVDDEQRTLEGEAQRVRQSGFDLDIVGLAHDGIEALELTRTHRPDIILCDIRMPGMDGIAFTIKAKQIDPDVAIIFITGYSDREYLKNAIRIGAVDYLDKPVDEDQFKEALGRAVERRAMTANHPVRPPFDQDTLRLLLTSNNEQIIGRISGQAEQEQAQYMVVVATYYRHESTDDSEQQFNMFTLHMVSVFSEERHYQYTTLRMGSQIILFIKNDQKELGPAMEKQVRELMESMLAGLPEAREHISVGIGSRFERLTDTNRSYRMACKALDLTFFRGIGSVISWGDVRGGQYAVHEGQLYDINLFCENDELLRVTEAVDRIFQKFAGNENTPAASVRAVTLKIYDILARNYEKEFMEPLLDSQSGLQKTVMSAFTMEQLAGILHQLIAKYTNTILTKDKKNGAIYNAKKYIWKHLGDDVSVKSIARTVYLSPTYLCALFKDVTGITVNQYVQEARIEKAKTLLMGTSHTINEIADLVGYKNAGYFSRIFARHTGTTPILFRKMNLNV